MLRGSLEPARRVGLPEGAAALAELVDPEQLPVLASALVRVALDRTKGDPLG